MEFSPIRCTFPNKFVHRLLCSEIFFPYLKQQYYDPRGAKSPSEIVVEDTGSANVLAILDHNYPWGKEADTEAKGQRLI